MSVSCSVLVSALEALPLLEAATQAACPLPKEDLAALGRGQRKRSNRSMAELGERAFKRLLREGQASAADQPAGLRRVVLVGAKSYGQQAGLHR